MSWGLPEPASADRGGPDPAARQPASMRSWTTALSNFLFVLAASRQEDRRHIKLAEQ
jgi:hypothetical protein